MSNKHKAPIDFSIGYHNLGGIHDYILGCKLTNIKFINDLEIISEIWGKCIHDKEISGYKKIIDIEPQKETKKGRSSSGINIYFNGTNFRGEKFSRGI